MATDDPGNARPQRPGRSKSKLTIKVVEAELRKSAGIMSIVAERLGVNRSTITRFVQKHDRLRLLIEEVTDETNDIAESQLLLALRRGEAWAVRFYLKERGQSRGYGQRKLAFKDGEGNVVVPAVLVTPDAMTPEQWDATDWAAQSAANNPPPTLQ